MKPKMVRARSVVVAAVGALSLVTFATAGSSASPGAATTPMPIADGAPAAGGGGSSGVIVFVVLALLAGGGYVAWKMFKRSPSTDAGHAACLAEWKTTGDAARSQRQSAGDSLAATLERIEGDFEALERALDDAARAFASLSPEVDRADAVAQDDSIEVVRRVLAGIDGPGGVR